MRLIFVLELPSIELLLYLGERHGKCLCAIDVGIVIGKAECFGNSFAEVVFNYALPILKGGFG